MKVTSEFRVASAALRRACLEYRAENNLTQEDMARLCQVNRSTIVKCENQKPLQQVSQIKIYRICQNRII